MFTTAIFQETVNKSGKLGVSQLGVLAFKEHKQKQTLKLSGYFGRLFIVRNWWTNLKSEAWECITTNTPKSRAWRETLVLDCFCWHPTRSDPNIPLPSILTQFQRPRTEQLPGQVWVTHQSSCLENRQGEEDLTLCDSTVDTGTCNYLSTRKHNELELPQWRSQHYFGRWDGCWEAREK